MRAQRTSWWDTGGGTQGLCLWSDYGETSSLLVGAREQSHEVTCCDQFIQDRFLFFSFLSLTMGALLLCPLRRGMEVYRLGPADAASGGGVSARASSCSPGLDMTLTLVRDLTLSSDVLNAAEWQVCTPHAPRCACLGR